MTNDATILAGAGTCAALVQASGFAQAAGAIMLVANVIVIGLSVWRKYK